MATIDFTCQKCEGNFEIDSTDLIDGSEELECPHCNAKPSKAAAEDFSTALGELLAQIAALQKKFAVSLSVDTEDLADEAKEEEDDDDDDDDESDDDDEDDDDDDDDLEEDDDFAQDED